MAQRLIGRYQGEAVFDNDDWDSEIKCPSCGLNAGEKDGDHSSSGTLCYHCAECGYVWSEPCDIENWREER
jgi:uncharacterized Zn finger protein